MYPNQHDRTPARPLNLASSRGAQGNGAARPVPLGVNERIRGPRPAGSPSQRPAPRGQGAPSPARQGRPAARQTPHTGAAPTRRASSGSARRGTAAPSGRTPAPRAGARRGGCRSSARPRPGTRGHGAYYLHGAPKRRGGLIGALSDPRLIVALVAIVVIGFGAFTANAAIQRRDERIAAEEQAAQRQRLERQTVKVAKLGPTVMPLSTPRAQWRQGVMPYLFQQDPLWSSAPYSDNTLGTSGCGPTSLAMVYIYATGKTDYGPREIGELADASGYTATGGTDWTLMSEGAEKLGLTVESLPLDRASITAALDAGRPIICNVGPGDFTGGGHYLVLSDIDERGMVTVHDPNSPYNSSRSWPITRLMPQIKNPWAYSA